MEKIFKYLGKKAGETYKKSKWIYASLLGDEDDAIKAEYQFGLQMAKQMQSNSVLTQSVSVDSIAEKLTDKLNTKRKFNFYIISSPEINAFALPGGFVFFTDSLLNFCAGSEDEIAFVLSHEIGHVIKGHSFNRLLAEYSLATIGKFIRVTGVFQAAVKEITSRYLASKYSRDNEFEADNFGVRLMKAAKFNPGGAVSFFDKLSQLKEGRSEFPAYFSSHPTTDERIKNVAELINK